MISICKVVYKHYLTKMVHKNLRERILFMNEETEVEI